MGRARRSRTSPNCSATAGFDWLLIDNEHAPNDVRSTLAQLQAVAAYPSHPVVRPVRSDSALIKQLLDIGAQTLLLPMIDTARTGRRSCRRDALSAARHSRRGQCAWRGRRAGTGFPIT